MEQINIKLDLIIDKLKLLEDKIDLLNKRVDGCEKSCQSMDDHIDFVKGTYISLRAPLDFMRSKINMLSGQESLSLPQITNS